ncbi:hypothetical protein AURDEDRAFT_115547 [Auricularia subglabra TFB-10046 SS5]|nr:hypothetical protein AURDEDRAFT_115547 [Auricularia subglabra TFB-10046 SS5]
MAQEKIHDGDWYAKLRDTPLDPSLYAPRDEEKAFYKQQTGIESDHELREHILAVQARAFKVWPYPCIRRLAFTKLKISRFPVYNEVLKLGRERPDAILLDLGCCFGNDARRAVADGFPATQVIASDLRAEFWALGHELFRSSPETCPIRFVQGDVFAPSFISPHETSLFAPGDPIDACVESGSLNPLQKRASVIHTSAFFHLFNEEQQLEIARRCNALLSNEPGSLIFGSHRGVEKATVRQGRDSFAHDPESWKAMWKQVATEGNVEVEAYLSDFETAPSGTTAVKAVDENGEPLHPGSWLVWVVRRI